MTPIELLKMQMKMQYNASLTPMPPGDYLKFAKQALVIIQTHSHEPDTVRQCLGIIRQYIECLNRVNREFSDQNKIPSQSRLMLHSFFLSDLHLYDPDWVEQRMAEYPYAFVHVGESWSAWTTILR